MDIKERFYNKLEQIREDYDKGAADDAKELTNLGSGKPSRKGDKKILKAFRSDAKKYAKKAVTGLDEEQLDELRRPKNPDKGRKFVSGGARAAEDAAAKKYYDKYDDETVKRRKAIKSKSEDDKQAADKANAERQKAAKRVIKLQKIKEEQEQMDAEKKSNKKDNLFF